MTINRIGPLEPIQPNKKPGRSEPTGGSDRTDTINLSEEARKKAEVYQIAELVKAAPELDEARIVELRQKLDDPAYIDERIAATADNILSAWFG